LRRNPTETLLLLSGEYPTIPFSEVHAVLAAEKVEFTEEERGDQILILGSDRDLLDVVERRAAFVMEGGTCIASSEPNLQCMERCFRQADWTFLGDRSFGVKVTRVKEYSCDLDTQDLQKRIGKVIKEETNAKVNLEKPDVWIRAVITDRGIFAFFRGLQSDRSVFSRRRPKTRPYFHPGVMDPKISRAFVNLSRVMGGELFVDPFCGTGGFLIEGAMMGCEVCGMDLDLRMVLGARKNLSHYGLSAELLHSDANEIPLSRADGIATDPPYGRGTSTMGSSVRKILAGFFRESERLLAKGRFLCTAAPVELDPSGLAREAGFIVREEHRMRVHKSLTRSIIVAERD
jgi:tRNA (guanine10-N2)-dimethyltransferase